MTNSNNDIADFSELSNIKTPSVREGQEARVGSWPERSVPMAKTEVVQISVRAPVETIDRLKRLCSDERYSYGDMLKRLLDAYER